ncbi:Uncharacterized protein TCM_004877 [Theobroma cacao]|uniref:Uncharacterized protein n=1 Tax=Theobroma cacao TaxID=3641 RepID=A0A061DRD3_THECC|nr:Uncharacterized protein TCM_004877 [Theobroma cacao]
MLALKGDPKAKLWSWNLLIYTNMVLNPILSHNGGEENSGNAGIAVFQFPKHLAAPRSISMEYKNRPSLVVVSRKLP